MDGLRGLRESETSAGGAMVRDVEPAIDPTDALTVPVPWPTLAASPTVLDPLLNVNSPALLDAHVTA